MTPPQNQISVLTEEEIKAKFDELGMLAFLSKTCKPRNVKRKAKSSAKRPYRAERGVTFVRKSDGESQAVLYFWKTPDGEEHFRVQGFTAPDGTFYNTDLITHPSNIATKPPSAPTTTI
jgi:hypothetical protein